MSHGHGAFPATSWKDRKPCSGCPGWQSAQNRRATLHDPPALRHPRKRCRTTGACIHRVSTRFPPERATFSTGFPHIPRPYYCLLPQMYYSLSERAERAWNGPGFAGLHRVRSGPLALAVLCWTWYPISDFRQGQKRSGAHLRYGVASRSFLALEGLPRQRQCRLYPTTPSSAGMSTAPPETASPRACNFRGGMTQTDPSRNGRGRSPARLRRAGTPHQNEIGERGPRQGDARSERKRTKC